MSQQAAAIAATVPSYDFETASSSRLRTSNGTTVQPAVKSTTNGTKPPSDYHIWMVTGPAGCGKSTIAKYLATSMNLPYVEGDEFHPKANIEKMRTGTPLDDVDRWDWLVALREESIRQISLGHEQVVLTCSALKRKYRDVIRVAPYFHQGVHLHFIFLIADEETLLQRVAGRKDHYMGPGMVHSQLDILESPAEDETDVITVDVSRPVDEIKADVMQRVKTVVAETNSKA